MEKEQKTKEKSRLKNISNEEKVMAGVIIVLLIGVIVLAYPYLKNLGGKEKIYSVDIVKIEGCDECFNLDLVSNALNSIENIKISDEKTLNYDSSEAQKLIEKYNIEKIPALIVSSKAIDKIALDENIFRKEENTAIFDKAVPYIELSSGEVVGIVNMKEVYDSNCKECTSLSKLKTQLEGMGIKINKYEMISYSSDEGKKLVAENEITYLPTLLVSKEISKYWWAFDSIIKSFEENEEYYRFAEPFFPNKEILTGKIKGKVEMIYITNKSCEDCFNVTSLKSIFQNLGIYVDSERYADVASSEGKNLLAKYNITAIPTTILSKEISDYTSIKEILEQVGTFESDKGFILRKLDALRVKYQNTGG